MLSKVAKAIIDKFSTQINSKAICLSSSVPKLAPLKDLKISNEVLSFIEKYEPQIAKNGGVYEHQEKVLNAISNTQLPNIIMTTSTGSGKSLCFWSWIVSALTKNRNATAIVSCPTQALLWGQSERLRRISRKDSLITYEIDSSEQLAYAGEIEFGNKVIGWTVWYGVQNDKNMKELPKLPQFRNARIRIATLDKIHWNLFRDWESEINFLKNLKCFVIDEAHVWNGLAGANVRRMIDRLKLSSDVYGLKYPAFFLASATLANPIEFAENLTGGPSKDFLAIDDIGSSKIEILDTDQVPDQLNKIDSNLLRRYVILIRPQPKTVSALDLLRDEKLIGKINILNFVQSKFIGHRRYWELRETPNRKAVSYDADLPTDKRRAIEKELQDKNLTGKTVIATSAFEVGIDIPSLDMIIMDELPPSRTELLQRLGRVGRSINRPGLAVLCLRYSPFDEQLLRQPQETLSVRNAKMLPVPLHLDIVKLKAMITAFNEWMYRLRYGYAEWGLFNKALQKHFSETPTYQELNEKINNRLQELIDIDQKNWYYKGFRVSASQGKIKLVRKDNNEEIAYIEDIAVSRDAHPEGIYLSHKGQRYRIRNYVGNFKLGKWTDPNSDIILGKFFKSLHRIEVEPERRKIATRGKWVDSFTLYEERELAGNSEIPKSGKFDYGIWEFIRRFDGYIEIELNNKNKPAKTVSLAEVADRFKRTIENGQDFPFLHNFSYRTLGWRWKIVRILEEEKRNLLNEILPGILNDYLCDAVECSKNDLSVSFDPKSGDFRVVDTTPGGNGLSEALLSDNRIINGLSNTIGSLKAITQQTFETFLNQQCHIRSEIYLEEVIDAVSKMESAWKG
jgi:superfamily II DNA/RNA helicase